MGTAGAAGVGGTGGVDGATLEVSVGFGFAAIGGVGVAAFFTGAAAVPVPAGWATNFGAPTAGTDVDRVLIADTDRTGVVDGGVVCAVATAVKK